MGRKGVMFIFLWVLLFQLIRIDAASSPTHISTSCASYHFNYTDNSIYEQNLDLLLSDLSPQAAVVKFYNSTVGESPNKVYGLFQCRQDLSLDVCSRCMQDATQGIMVDCPLSGEAVAWYYECMLRYSYRNIFSLMEILPSHNTWSWHNVSDITRFAPVLGNTMDSVITAAVASSPSGHFATREANLTFPEKLYCLAQCTPDIDSFNCNRCLRTALAVINGDCTGCIRSTAFSPSCQLRYDLTPFYNETIPAPSAPNSPAPNSPPRAGKNSTTYIIVGVAGAVAVGLLLLVAGMWVCLRRRKAKEPKEPATVMPKEESKEPHDHRNHDGANSVGDAEFEQYDFATLNTATGDFSIDNKLGEGGFGAVYKGVLKTGQILAIKRLSGNSGQGVREFMTEARIVAQLQHRNLVKLIGVCSAGNEKLLVYEFMPNTSLDHFLFDPRKRALLEWDTRCKIIMGIARGLQYLHEDSRLTIIHRDLKTSNILLDGDMNAKIADFGMAKLFGGEQNFGNTSRIVGTYGYMAPEYVRQGEYSDKSDVYSFGIIVLEILSGQKNRVYYQAPQREDLPIYTWKLWKEGQALEIMDPILLNKCSTNEVMRCIHIGLLCVQGNPANRPTMGRVVLMLNGLVALPTPSSPAMPSQDFRVSMNNDDFVWPNDSEQSTVKSVTWKTTELEQDLYPR